MLLNVYIILLLFYSGNNKSDESPRENEVARGKIFNCYSEFSFGFKKKVMEAWAMMIVCFFFSFGLYHQASYNGLTFM